VTVEADHVAIIGAERYNSTENGKTRFPVVADPPGFDLNQAYLKYTTKALAVTAGRQRILLDDQRHIGGVAWRQNEQTFDGIRLQYQLTQATTIDYSYLWNVHRIFGPDDGLQPSDWHSQSHLLNVGYQFAEHQLLRGFSYLQDFTNDNGPENSVASYGIAYAGSFSNWSVTAEVARQTDHADNPQNFRTHYISLALSYTARSLKLQTGYDILGSDAGIAGFRTPLATLHKFQGWSDRFLSTPVSGVKDLHLGFSNTRAALEFGASWHKFSAVRYSNSLDIAPGKDLGQEINVFAGYKFNRHLSLQLKFAAYRARKFSADVTKAWLSVVLEI